MRSVPSDDELRRGLEPSLRERFGPDRSVTRFDRRTGKFQTSFPLEEVEVHLDDGSSIRLVYKDLSWEALPERARAAKPKFLHDPLREIDVYRTALAGAGLGTPDYYGSVVDEGRDRHWLFLESVPGVALWQIGDFELWRHAARWLASLHHRFAGEAPPGGAAHLLRHDPAFYRSWLQRALELTPARDERRRRGLERIASGHEQVVERLCALPPALIHGEFYASNVLVVEGPNAVRICPIDWELAAVGPGLMDLAALTTGNWSDEERRSLALSYHDALAGLSGNVPAEDVLLAALDHCHLQLAVQWLGWAADWKPPRAHRHDWMSEALALVEKLQL